MDLVLQRVSKRQRVRSAQSTSEYVLDVSQTAGNKNVICLSKWQKGAEGDTRLSEPICQWEKAKRERFGSCAVLDSRQGLVFASLKDRRRYVTLQVPNDTTRGLVDESIRELELKSPLFSLSVIPGITAADDGDLVVAVSDTGELAIISATGRTSEIDKRALDPLPVDRVLAVSPFAEDSLVIIGLQNSGVVVYPIRFKAGESFAAISVEQRTALYLPDVPKSVLSSTASQESSILDFVFDEKYMAVLYAGGIVHILRPHPSTDALPNGDTKFGTWYQDREHGAGHDVSVVPKLDHAFQLSPGSTENEAGSVSAAVKVAQGSWGGIAKLDENYFAIGYGKYVSIWDWAYHVGHGVAQMDGSVTSVSPGRSRTKALIGNVNGLQELSATDLEHGTPFSLGLAITRKGTCDPIVTDLHRASEAVPMRSQPVTVTVTKIAAEAEGDVDQVFRQRLEPLDGDELKLVRQLLNRTETGSPESVSRLTSHYTTGHKKVRRGNRGSYADMGLSELPSERLAAVSVARCLYEMHFGNSKFVVPLIDVIGTGVVSSEAVLAVMGTSDSWSMGEDSGPLAMLSIVDPLMTSGMFLNALEAVVTRVADLPEPDIVRILQFIIRLTDEDFSEFVKQIDVSESETDAGKFATLARATHLLLKCVTCAVDRGRVVASLRQIPIADVIAIMIRFDHMLNAAATPSEVKKRAKVPRASLAIRDGFFFKDSAFFDEEEIGTYRGVGDWMDDDENRNTLGSKSVISGCIEWSSHLIDAHLANLIMDKTGQELAGRLLETVRVRRGEFEVIKSLHGLTLHLIDGKPVPNQDDPLYSNTIMDVPAYASLQ